MSSAHEHRRQRSRHGSYQLYHGFVHWRVCAGRQWQLISRKVQISTSNSWHSLARSVQFHAVKLVDHSIYYISCSNWGRMRHIFSHDELVCCKRVGLSNGCLWLGTHRHVHWEYRVACKNSHAYYRLLLLRKPRLIKPELWTGAHETGVTEKKTCSPKVYLNKLNYFAGDLRHNPLTSRDT